MEPYQHMNQVLSFVEEALDNATAAARQHRLREQEVEVLKAMLEKLDGEQLAAVRNTIEEVIR